MLYLDNSATTKILPEVYKEMEPFLMNFYGNANSLYYDQANVAKQAVLKARKQIADLLNCDVDEIIFTSGSTESNNMIIKGYTHANIDKGKHIVVSSIEHSSIINTVHFLEDNGYEITYLPVDHNGFVNISELKKSIRDDTILVSIMWANNELGGINNIKEISDYCLLKNIAFHTDATQYVGKGVIDLKKYTGVTFLSISGHKIYGPKGIGIAFIRKDKNGLYPKIVPLIHGGNQEFGLRSGTLPTHQIVGIGKAAEIAKINMCNNIQCLIELEEKFKKRITNIFGEKIVINNQFKNKIPGLISIRIVGYNNQLFLKKASNILAASSGSACSNEKPSYVLKNCGYSEKEISETIRISLSPYDDYNDFLELE